jgi:hypothetical protein
VGEKCGVESEKRFSFPSVSASTVAADSALGRRAAKLIKMARAACMATQIYDLSHFLPN